MLNKEQFKKVLYSEDFDDQLNYTYEEIEKNGLAAVCLKCPLKKECDAYEGWYGCGAWEASMGDDL